MRGAVEAYFFACIGISPQNFEHAAPGWAGGGGFMSCRTSADLCWVMQSRTRQHCFEGKAEISFISTYPSVGNSLLALVCAKQY